MVLIKKGSYTVAESLRNLCCETFYNKWKSTNTETDLQTYMNEFFSIEKLTEELNDNRIIYLLAQNANQLIGYTKLNRNKADGDLGNLKSIELQRMYVKEEFTGHGIGQQLMNSAIEIASTDKFKVMWLGVWEQNTEAIKFYKRFGFEFYGSHQFVLGEDITTDLLMKKIL
ncbi:MAG: GNAT family N-acetyltransferase [Sphingobacteriales bacterium]|nr:MAG: GNAT family N-acetyltransferase [Sphingobacteriales bacterium]